MKKMNEGKYRVTRFARDKYRVPDLSLFYSQIKNTRVHIMKTLIIIYHLYIYLTFSI